VGFFWDRLNVHTFNCRHRADRRVKGWLRKNGWAEGWAEEWMNRWAEHVREAQEAHVGGV
jgi:hypothetical protein